MRALFLSFFFALSLAAKPVTVAVAANVSYAIDDLIKAYESQHPGQKIRVILGSSGKLTAQIRHGAPYDLFLSADMGYPKALYREGLAIDAPKVYAKGVLALLSPTPRDLSAGLRTLLAPDIRRIALANPKTAPYGKAATEALKKARLYETLKPKFIYGESVSQTLAYTLKAADIGLVAKSALYSPKLRRYRQGTHWIEIDPALYMPIAQGAVLLKPAARGFYDFLFTPRAKAIFQSYGYRLP
ncbi:molybdate ABC transporter substrate-binding protein [Hydrogenimonas sp.]